MFNKILVPIDITSTHCFEAVALQIETAISIANEADSKIYVYHAIKNPGTFMGLVRIDDLESKDKQYDALKDFCLKFIQKAGLKGIFLDVEIEGVENIVDGIIAYQKMLDADLTIINAHNFKNGGFIDKFGSKAKELLKKSQTPTLVIKPSLDIYDTASIAPAPNPIRLAVAIPPKEQLSKETWNYWSNLNCKLADLFDTELKYFSASMTVQPAALPGSMAITSQSYLTRQRQSLQDRENELLQFKSLANGHSRIIQTKVIDDQFDIAIAAVQYIDRISDTWGIVVSKDKDSFERWINGSVAQTIALESKSPTLIIPESYLLKASSGYNQEQREPTNANA